MPNRTGESKEERARNAENPMGPDLREVFVCHDVDSLLGRYLGLDTIDQLRTVRSLPPVVSWTSAFLEVRESMTIKTTNPRTPLAIIAYHPHREDLVMKIDDFVTKYKNADKDTTFEILAIVVYNIKHGIDDIIASGLDHVLYRTTLASWNTDRGVGSKGQEMKFPLDYEIDNLKLPTLGPLTQFGETDMEPYSRVNNLFRSLVAATGSKWNAKHPKTNTGNKTSAGKEKVINANLTPAWMRPKEPQMASVLPEIPQHPATEVIFDFATDPDFDSDEMKAHLKAHNVKGMYSRRKVMVRLDTMERTEHFRDEARRQLQFQQFGINIGQMRMHVTDQTGNVIKFGLAVTDHEAYLWKEIVARAEAAKSVLVDIFPVFLREGVDLFECGDIPQKFTGVIKIVDEKMVLVDETPDKTNPKGDEARADDDGKVVPQAEGSSAEEHEEEQDEMDEGTL